MWTDDTPFPKKIYVAFWLLMIVLALSMMPRASAEGSYELVWKPNRFEGEKILGVARDRNTGHVGVYINPDKVLQRGASFGNIAGSEFILETREWEVVSDLDPKFASKEHGYRDPENKHKYFMLEFEELVTAKGAEPQHIFIHSNGNGNYWVTIYTVRPRGYETVASRVKEARQ
jgi:hypothetical protein